MKILKTPVGFSNVISEGATALKLEDEVQQQEQPNISSEDVITNHVTQDENVEEILKLNDTNSSAQEIEDASVSNGLENFDIQDDAPDLFNSDSAENNDNEFESFSKSENDEEEDDLEIPAFLRRQKN